ncbi:hypothetical protein JCM33374_g397 [Metschnikowia sp. JCM 33374]|nr:hypothetical protein JCM33374_g397 [Metschnikowia sp. JCM 33374]
MNPASVVDEQLHYIHHILQTVPFGPGAKTNGFFLDTYRLAYSDIKQLGITEKSWESYSQVSASKLLKLSISFGNLVKTFHQEKTSHEARLAQQNPRRQLRQTVDPFQDTFASEKTFSVAPHYVNLVKNVYLVLKNFDIGPVAGNTASNTTMASMASATQQSRMSHVSRTSIAESDVFSMNNGSQPNGINSVSNTNTNPNIGSTMSSPIRLNSRQLLVEKLEINIRLDALFTYKITLKLLRSIFDILKSSLSSYTPPEEPVEESRRKSQSETSSIFSSISGSSGVLESITNIEDYTRLLAEVSRRVTMGILDPFTDLLRESIVKPTILGGFQDLVNTI